METRDQQVVKALSGLQLAYRDSLSKSQMKFYADMLRDIHPVVLDKAIKKLICTSKFLPTVAEIRETAEKMITKVNGTRQKDMNEAWEEVMEQVRICFVYQAPKFSTPEIAETVKSMGWRNLCMMETRQSSTYRAQFRDTYKIACTRHSENALDRKLGVYEIPISATKESKLQRIGECMGGHEDD
ncbi:hypothetical protein NXG27_01035 [Megasphaera paucivorans]|uniref:Loader and inhibitor of phage G40P n=1 Tax=Megasphaera paucivorans TaxID=349095 RepID=A0A1G9QFK1_9FIRM|nr:hypothetical protein [Megasphaera paucivorans]SDM09287.1 hypothetical protein SAMN05660299_00208 [Megasphaera paucivorans]